MQKPGEIVDEYVVRLRQMAESCEFDTLKDTLIRDRIVIGTTDEGGRERLFRERPVPNLEKAIESLRAFDISRTRKQVICGREPEIIQHTEKRRNTYKPKGPRRAGKTGEQKKPAKPRQQQRQSESCKWCGRKEDHTRKDCPARDAKCHLCQKKGHFATVCQSSKCVNAVDKDDCFDNYHTMGEVSPNREDFWSSDVNVNSNSCEFKLDSGSKVTVVGDHTPWLKGLKLDPVKSEFRGPGNIKLSYLFKGQSTNATLKAGGRSHREKMYVITNQANNLLSKPAIQAFQLLTPAPEVHNVEKVPDFRAEYPKLFKGLGLIGQEYRIPLKENAVPVCLYTPRRVPHPLLPKVKEKLDSMVQDNVISPVTVPTDWCSGMVITPKRKVDVRIFFLN